MKKNDITKLHSSTPAELSQKVTDLQKELVISRLDVKMGKETNIKKPHAIRTDIAVVKTIMRQLELQTNKTK